MIFRSVLLQILFLLSGFIFLLVQLGCANATQCYQYATIYSKAGKYDSAITWYNHAIRRKSGYADAYHGRGRVYYELKNYDKAIADYNKAIELSQNDAPIYVSRAEVYRLKNDYDRAIRDYTRAIQVQPDYLDAYYKRSTLYSKIGSHDKAIADCTKARGFKPNDIDANQYGGDAYHFSGEALLKKKEYSKATTHLTIAIELYSFALDAAKRSDDYSAYGTSLANQKMAIKVQYIETVLAYAFFSRGTIYVRKGDNDKAISDFSKTIEFQPDNHLAHRTRGDIYFKEGLYISAIADYTRLIELQPTDDLGYNLRGKAHRANGDADSANTDFAVAAQLRNAQ